MSATLLPANSRLISSSLTSASPASRFNTPARASSVTAASTLSSASASASAPITALHTAAHSSSASSSSRLSLALVAAALSAACVTFYQLRPAANEATPVQPSQPGTPGLSSKDFTALKLKSVEPYNHNSAIYTFALPDANAYLNLPVSSCIMLRGKVDGKDVVRPYTPIDTHRKGEVVLLIKSYDKGLLSKYVTQLQPGDTLDFKGPMPKLKYEAGLKRKVGMLAGGTGITPMLQVLEEIARNPKDNTEAHLVVANVSGKDILLKETLDALAEQHNNIHVTTLAHTLRGVRSYRRLDISVIIQPCRVTDCHCVPLVLCACCCCCCCR